MTTPRALNTASRRLLADEGKHLMDAVQVRASLTSTYLRLGHTRKAAAIVSGCIESCDAIGSLQFKPMVLEIVASIAYARGEFLKAKRLNEESYHFYRRWDRQSRAAYQLETISTTLIQLGDIASARRVYEEACALNVARSQWEETIHHIRDGLILVAEGAFDRAEQQVREGLRLSRLRKAARLEIIVHGVLGEIALRRARAICNSEAAAEMAQRGLHQFILQLILCARIKNMMYLIPCIGWLGQAFLAQRDYATARIILSWAREWATKAEADGDHALILVAFARLEEEGGTRDASTAAWQTALDAARAVHMGRLITECEARVVAVEGKS